MLKINIFNMVFVSVLFSVNLMGQGADEYTKALISYQNKNYKNAYPSIEKEAKKGNKEAQYILAQMYENGEEVKIDTSKAMYWYKQAASRYAYVQEDYKKSLSSKDEGFFDRVKKQFKYTSEEKGVNYAFSKIDEDTPEVKSMIMKSLERNFGLQPYHSNYFAPFTYSSSKYTRSSSLSAVTSPQVEYDNNIEAEYQLSFQKPLTYNLFGWNEYINFAYTQQVWWKLYDSSSPFRETNYTPEMFMILPTSDHMDEKYNMKAYKFGFRHQSNGGDGDASRSWNRLFLASLWQWDSLFMKVEGWYTIPEEKKSDDNPDITDYLGYGEVTFKYLYGQHQFNLLLRNNLDVDENKGAVQLDYTAPFFNSDNTFWYVKLFSGYGESLIDYDKSVTKMSIGFAFSRGMF